MNNEKRLTGLDLRLIRDLLTDGNNPLTLTELKIIYFKLGLTVGNDALDETEEQTKKDYRDSLELKEALNLIHKFRMCEYESLLDKIKNWSAIDNGDLTLLKVWIKEAAGMLECYHCTNVASIYFELNPKDFPSAIHPAYRERVEDCYKDQIWACDEYGDCLHGPSFEFDHIETLEIKYED